MKTSIKLIALVAFLFTGLNSKAQDSQYISSLYKTDSVGADAIVKDIVKLSGKGFKLTSRQVKNGVVLYQFENPQNNSDNLMVSLSTWMDGENKDLGVRGNKVYKLKSIYGTFLDLYPFWKNHISAKLSPEELTKGTGETYTLSSFKKLRFKKYEDLIWSIDCI